MVIFNHVQRTMDGVGVRTQQDAVGSFPKRLYTIFNIKCEKDITWTTKDEVDSPEIRTLLTFKEMQKIKIT